MAPEEGGVVMMRGHGTEEREHRRGLDEGDEKKGEDKRQRCAINNLHIRHRIKTYKIYVCLSNWTALFC